MVEKAIMEHHDVFDCAAFAKHCPLLGEVPSAWIVLKKGVPADEVN